MRNFVLSYLLPFLLMFICVCQLQCQEIDYGLNNGKYVEVQDRKIYYEEYGEGKTVLMLHGGPGSISHFSNLIPDLSSEYRVIAMDAPGQGRSQRIADVSHQLLAENASAFIDVLGISNCFVLGWSDGATTALILAEKRPDVIDKVFVSGGFSNIDGLTKEDREFWFTITPEVVESSWGGWHIEYQKRYPENDWKTIINDIKNMMTSSDIYITEPQLQSIKAEVLLAWGDKDLATLEHIAYLYRIIPNTELMILPGTSHSTFKEQPEMISLAARQFFAK